MRRSTTPTGVRGRAWRVREFPGLGVVFVVHRRTVVDHTGVRAGRPTRYPARPAAGWRRSSVERQLERYAVALLMRQMVLDGDIEQVRRGRSWRDGQFRAKRTYDHVLLDALSQAQDDRGWANARTVQAALPTSRTLREVQRGLDELVAGQRAEVWVPAGTTRYWRLVPAEEPTARASPVAGRGAPTVPS